ncbi:hypothetical protein PHYSODRAFT_286176 [Phytophthora sojae]|uniref:RxLR effector protein n=2 Tax=Phytophthora sojae TaxID=67593 RepID=G4ZLK0_PHYSP|nr:hypothetical protein PHYSODRAFT_286176 [Phytophthora sojae]AEK80639.1 Avh90 [Phytophthora sojae]AEK80640.1 Avh90 [Phytophthora sojae]AEK80641.1 Avh90 [Phytophthora sojae]EGZ14575.1 hypothetical protein PHYSODRAFT_286176 [Phytophthora sojae]|eukprot:XP_009528324.1 hypothetical protein PHYSODRAFT_286176 [Phytophthora sojae]
MRLTCLLAFVVAAAVQSSTNALTSNEGATLTMASPDMVHDVETTLNEGTRHLRKAEPADTSNQDDDDDEERGFKTSLKSFIKSAKQSFGLSKTDTKALAQYLYAQRNGFV